MKISTGIPVYYRPTINTVEEVKKYAVFDLGLLKEPCIFVFKDSRCRNNSHEFSTEYFIKQHNPQEEIFVRTYKTKLLTKIVPEKTKRLGIYIVKEYPLATDFYSWESYKKAKREGNNDLAKKIKENLYIPEKEEIKFPGFTYKYANEIAKRIARRRANEIARKINYPILNEIINLNE